MDIQNVFVNQQLGSYKPRKHKYMYIQTQSQILIHILHIAINYMLGLLDVLSNCIVPVIKYIKRRFILSFDTSLMLDLHYQPHSLISA